MKKIIIKAFLIISLISGLALFSYLFLPRDEARPAYASSGDGKLAGFAWSSNVGWISFNSTNCDSDENGAMDNPSPCNSLGLPVPMADYDVAVDIGGGSQTRGHLSGYAWSSNVGWIFFGDGSGTPTSTPDNVFDVGCELSPSQEPCSPLVNGCIACMDLSADANGHYNVYGWAKVLSMGDDGWVRLRNDDRGYGIRFSNFNPSTNSATAEGFAWNAFPDLSPSDILGIGWISFSSENIDCDTNNDNLSDGGPNCPTVGDPVGDYWVVVEGLNSPPDLNLNSGNFSTVASSSMNICQGQSLSARIEWDNSIFSDPDGDGFASYDIFIIDNLDNVAVNATSIPNNGFYNFSTGINYNRTYTVGFRGIDSRGAASEWATSTDLFTTPLHRGPDTDFTSEVPGGDPSALQDILVTSNSAYYTTASPVTSAPCDDSNCYYVWSTTSDSNIAQPNASSTTINFQQSGANQYIILTVTDNDNYSCSRNSLFNVEKQLPIWIEPKKQ
jgi:hypothetical protein